MSEAIEKPTLPWSERLQVRVLIISLKMLEGQLRELPKGPDTATHFITSAAALVTSWREQAEALHAGTVDAPKPAPVRPKTMDADA